MRESNKYRKIVGDTDTVSVSLFLTEESLLFVRCIESREYHQAACK